MATIKIALLGFGTVGRGVYEVIQSHQNTLYEQTDSHIEVSAVLVQHPNQQRELPEHILVTDSIEDILKTDIHIVIEAIVGENPAYPYLKQAIEKGCHVITANKAMFANHGDELNQLATEHGVKVGYEATTAGGIPIIRTLQQLRVNQVQRIEGILNGTSNYILSKMADEQLEFDDALAQAKELGYAEADPANDIEGLDAFYKLMILSDTAFSSQPDWSDVMINGIKGITLDHIKETISSGKVIKHVATIQNEDGALRASVQPMLLSPDHPLASIKGVDNAITIDTDLLGKVTLQGPGAGRYPTASALLEDLVSVVKEEVQTSVPYRLQKHLQIVKG
ncbi:homoserine dehydrogenase [Pontibacillus halophilus JSM 076056 = DSM 19796]|uniref:Homoserine dehydrogenase n=1 Tax=Pontibacillus halophilus JSM 076056 = DSM 19796 TaxID=1385510 RepID=A0A0A5I625_9BACI|nr:homoserine dehydrogenase [Pontibacillus halophilus]KGX91282.1 homoserine dehydrogenase [Pontibacillus halophilus JSM 076056 = DSM 19796]